MKEWQSKAIWSNGSFSTDEHETEAQAQRVCDLLLREGNSLGKPLNAVVVFIGKEERLNEKLIC